MASSSKNKTDILKKFALQCIKKWPIFAISLFLSICFAVYYIYTTQPQYTRETQLLIKEESKNNKVSVSDLTEDFGTFSGNTNVNNELSRIQSPTLIGNVVKKLHLDINYQKASTLRKRVIYGVENPINIEILGIDENDFCDFDITLDSTSMIAYAKKSIKEEEANDTTKTDKPNDINKPKFKITNLKFGDTEVEGIWEGKLETSIILYKKLRVLVTYNSEYKSYSKDRSEHPFPENIHITKYGLVKSVEFFKQKLQVSLIDKKSSILNLSFSDADAKRAENVLIALIEAYNDNLLEGKNKIALSTSQFINDRLSLIERELGNVDENISTYKSRNLTPDVDEVAKLHLDKASQAQDKVSELDAQLAMLEYIRDFIANNHDKQFLPAVTNITNNVIEKSIEEYNALLLKRNDLLSNSSIKNPMVVSYDKNLGDMEKSILVNIDSQIDAIDNQILHLRKTEAKSKAKIASSPTQTKYLLGVERQQKVKETLYLFLLQKREENELSQAYSAYNNQIITQPNGKLEATSPIKKNILIVAILLGLLIPAAFVWVWESVKGRINNMDDLAELPVNLLGELPYSSNKIVVGAEKKDKENSAFRNLRTNLETIKSDEEIKSIMLTDLNSNSGKEYVAANLAKVIALKQKRVAIINFDKSDVTIDTLTEGKTGVYDFLSDKNPSWQNYVHQSKSDEYLFVMPTGTVPSNPSDYLEENKLQTLVSFLKAGFDMVVINCPSAADESSTMLIGKFVEQNIFVLNTETSTTKTLSILNNLAINEKFKNISVILNNKG
ncbi:MAG: Wzz/FepE/Etk N-terminal domain-containing protein [Paludibacteraceae bacterium]|nr:Wzz/FepE/Etk N-terminal domain-containing protein [Paludibacteraceae bacterium]